MRGFAKHFILLCDDAEQLKSFFRQDFGFSQNLKVLRDRGIVVITIGRPTEGQFSYFPGLLFSTSSKLTYGRRNRDDRSFPFRTECILLSEPIPISCCPSPAVVPPPLPCLVGLLLKNGFCFSRVVSRPLCSSPHSPCGHLIRPPSGAPSREEGNPDPPRSRREPGTPPVPERRPR